VECDPALSEKGIRLASCSIVCGLLSRRPHGVENTLYRKHIKSKVSTSALFFSWQSDTPPRVSRNIIEQALKLALEKISLDLEIEEAARSLELDRDTRGVGGSPPIVDTIFKKISAAAIFVADMTFVAKRRDGRPAPNPNVLIEYWWALRALGHGRIICVMNTLYGEPGDSLPFDMKHLTGRLSSAVLRKQHLRRGKGNSGAKGGS
jgi:hypothetical protein